MAIILLKSTWERGISLSTFLELAFAGFLQPGWVCCDFSHCSWVCLDLQLEANLSVPHCWLSDPCYSLNAGFSSGRCNASHITVVYWRKSDTIKLQPLRFLSAQDRWLICTCLAEGWGALVLPRGEAHMSCFGWKVTEAVVSLLASVGLCSSLWATW